MAKGNKAPAGSSPPDAEAASVVPQTDEQASLDNDERDLDADHAPAPVEPADQNGRLFALRPFNVSLRRQTVKLPPGEITDPDLLRHFGDSTPDGTERR